MKRTIYTQAKKDKIARDLLGLFVAVVLAAMIGAVIGLAF